MSDNTKEIKSKKQITERVAVKALITSYVCYGLILFFCWNIIKNLIQTSLLSSNLSFVTIKKLGFLIPTIFGILISVSLHILGRICTIDVFRKCKVSDEQINSIMSKMKVFFLLLIIGSICYSLLSFYVIISQDGVSIQLAILDNKNVFSPQYLSQMLTNMYDSFVKLRSYASKDAVITEIFLIASFLSLSSMQKDLIEKYNGELVQEQEKNTEEIKNNN